MGPPEFAPAIVEFVTGHVRSLDELQVLMAIIQSEERWWDAGAVAREFGMPTAAARTALDRFAAHNLLDIRITDDIRYQFRPGTEALRNAARATAEAYRKKPIAIARLVPVQPQTRRSIADFADAFRIRRDDDDR